MNYSLSPNERATEYFGRLPTISSMPGGTEDYRDRDSLAYALAQVPMLTPRRLKVIAVGAGFGGVDLARSVRVGKLPGVYLTVYEKNAGIGGTWHESRYPGYVSRTLVSAISNAWNRFDNKAQMCLRRASSQLPIHLGAEPTLDSLLRSSDGVQTVL